MGMEATLRSQMLTLFDLYSEYMALAPMTVSGAIHGNPRFYAGLKDNSLTFSAFSYDKVVAKFASEWPAGLPWPEGIEKVALSEVRTRTRKQRAERQPAA